MRVYKKQQLPKGCLSRAQTENLLVTLGLVIVILARIDKRFRRQDGTPNKLQIAKALEEEATKSVVNERITGQSSRAIRGRIGEALKIKDDNC